MSMGALPLERLMSGMRSDESLRAEPCTSARCAGKSCLLRLRLTWSAERERVAF